VWPRSQFFAREAARAQPPRHALRAHLTIQGWGRQTTVSLGGMPRTETGLSIVRVTQTSILLGTLGGQEHGASEDDAGRFRCCSRQG
jgi:hypothetical protein